jgi:hypothetical protein
MPTDGQSLASDVLKARPKNDLRFIRVVDPVPEDTSSKQALSFSLKRWELPDSRLG